jgi:hypothetical protein
VLRRATDQTIVQRHCGTPRPTNCKKVIQRRPASHAPMREPVDTAARGKASDVHGGTEAHSTAEGALT